MCIHKLVLLKINECREESFVTWEQEKRARDVVCCRIPKNLILLQPIVCGQVYCFVFHFLLVTLSPCSFIKTKLELNLGPGSKSNWELELGWFFKKIEFSLWFHFRILYGFILSPKPFFFFFFLSRSPFFGLTTHKTGKITSWKKKMHFLDLQKTKFYYYYCFQGVHLLILRIHKIKKMDSFLVSSQNQKRTPWKNDLFLGLAIYIYI